MREFVLTDVAADLWAESFELGPDGDGPRWRVAKRTLQGGRRHGVDLIEVDNGELVLSVLPTRGMGLWRGRFRGDRLGWDSPVKDGPVHPALVNLMNWGGLGWIEGFDELLVRCGLEHNGAPYAEASVQANGVARPTIYPLHGKIATLPAHRVVVRVEDGPPATISVEGEVDEAKLFGPKIRMTSRLTTVAGSNRVAVRDEFRNLGDQATEMQVLYHWNFGPPHLSAGAHFVAPWEVVVPRDGRAVEGLAGHDVYGAPEAGFAEQVYFYKLRASGQDGRTVALLQDVEGRRGVALRFAPAQLPCFTLWKNTGGLNDGYVTGLEPGTNYPNAKPFEQARGRVVRLEPGGHYEAETVLEVVDTEEGVRRIRDEIERIQGGAQPQMHPGPLEPYAPAG